jgi:hypothetical protein
VFTSKRFRGFTFLSFAVFLAIKLAGSRRDFSGHLASFLDYDFLVAKHQMSGREAEYPTEWYQRLCL